MKLLKTRITKSTAFYKEAKRIEYDKKLKSNIAYSNRGLKRIIIASNFKY